MRHSTSQRSTGWYFVRHKKRRQKSEEFSYALWQLFQRWSFTFFWWLCNSDCPQAYNICPDPGELLPSSVLKRLLISRRHCERVTALLRCDFVNHVSPDNHNKALKSRKAIQSNFSYMHQSQSTWTYWTLHSEILKAFFIFWG